MKTRGAPGAAAAAKRASASTGAKLAAHATAVPLQSGASRLHTMPPMW